MTRIFLYGVGAEVQRDGHLNKFQTFFVYIKLHFENLNMFVFYILSSALTIESFEFMGVWCWPLVIASIS